ncbi:hypothetical protein SKAU_G00319520 [Synaphobranchus kaupii]|uniref:Uncharacterized protein n=1 Tax=Synaphobranchus kaupii TaxID=118154 RepID=A0A9Q1ENH7_SYNKA|nr:hypothetical protein SKAU_G00319520 [Synaphobranchus kaupii]
MRISTHRSPACQKPNTAQTPPSTGPFRTPPGPQPPCVDPTAPDPSAALPAGANVSAPPPDCAGGGGGQLGLFLSSHLLRLPARWGLVASLVCVESDAEETLALTVVSCFCLHVCTSL